MIKLKACPFCGGKGNYITIHDTKWHIGIECKRCGLNVYFFKKGINVANTGKSDGDKAAIAKCWNRRVKI